MRAKRYLEQRLQDIIQAWGYVWPEKAQVEPPREAGLGDLASNLAMVLASRAGKNPRELAQDISSQILDQPGEVQSVQVAGPGFLNFTLKPSFWQGAVARVLEQGSDFGSCELGQKQKVLVEYVSANPTGPLHIGHGRGAAVGDSLVRILDFAGYQVQSEYYLNDAGRQITILGQSVWLRYQQVCGLEAQLSGELYQGEYILDLARELYQARGRELLQLEIEQALRICREHALQGILAGIKQDLENFRVRHQSWFNESSLEDVLPETLQELQESGLAYEQDGALWFKSTVFGDDKDRVLRKSNGELTYFASDIAYHSQKFSRGYDWLVDVWGSDHHGYVPRMKAAIQALDRRPGELQVVLIQLVNLLRAGQQVTMSTRAGEFVTLAQVCAEVGVDAARFIFLSRKSDSPLDFDLELLKTQSMENPVYYVQYAHARICSVLRKARDAGLQEEASQEGILAFLDTEDDLEILQQLEQFPQTVQAAARTLSPHHVSYYLLELAGKLHRYYNRQQILDLEQPGLSQARLLLVRAVARVLANGLNLLGVEAPQEM
ncbi:MAG: arginine--tRNA ligase [Thermodesulfobacteriota bacterium]